MVPSVGQRRRRALVARATRHSALVAAAVIAALVLGEVLLFGPYAGLDHTQVDLGFLCAIKRTWSEGRGLLLSPYLGLSGPLLFEPHAELLYPVRWLALLLPPPWDLAWSPLVHLSLIAAGTSWLLRTYQARPLSACLLGIGAATSGVMLDLILHTIYIVGGAWLPFVWAATRQALRGRATPVAPGLFLLLLLLGGEAQAFGIGVAIVVAELAAQHRAVARHRARAALVLSACLAGLLVGLLLWLPVLGEAQLGATALMSAEQSLDRSLSSDVALGAVWPNLLSTEYAQRDFSLVLRGPLAVPPWNPTPYVGALALALAFAAAALRRARLPLLVAAVFVLLALGPATPLLPWLLDVVPLLQRFRFPAKYLPMASIALFVCVGVLLRSLERSRATRRRVWLALLGALVACSAALVMTWVFADQLDLAASHLASDRDRPVSEIVSSAARWPVAVLLLACLALTSKRRAVLLAAIVAGELLVCGLSTVHSGPPLHDLGNAHLADLERRSIRAPTICVHSSAYALTLVVPGTEARWTQAVSYVMAGVADTQACAGQASAVSVSAPSQTRAASRLMAAVDAVPPGPAWALGCDRVVFVGGTREGARPLYASSPATSTELVRDLERAPDAFLLSHPVYVGDEEQLDRWVAGATSQAQALSVIDEPLEVRLASWSGLRAAHERGVGNDVAPAHSLVPVEASRPRVDEIAIVGATSGVYGVRSSYRAGWRAFLEDAEVPVVRVAGQMLGAVVDAGRAGTLRFVYRPPRLSLAVASAFVGVAGFVLVALLARRLRAGRPRRA